MRIIPLPTVDEILSLLPHILLLSGELNERPILDMEGNPKGTPKRPSVVAHLSGAMSNIDEELDMNEFNELDKAYLNLQIARTRRLEMLAFGYYGVSDIGSNLKKASSKTWPFVLGKNPNINIVKEHNPEDNPQELVIYVEVPLLDISRERFILRGQHQGPYGADDFEIRLEKRGGKWKTR